MNPTEVTYPVFEANQVLTNEHLNDLFEYLDEQTRLTRSNLIGIGIACGLEVTFEAPGTVHLSKGCGVTSQGYLIVEPTDLDLAFVRPYTLPIEYGYPPFVEPGTNPAEQFDLWELFPDDDEPGAQPLATSGLRARRQGGRAVPRAAQGRPAQLQPEQLRRPRRRGDRHRPTPADRRRRPRQGDRGHQRSLRSPTSGPTSPSDSPCPTCACRASTCPTADRSRRKRCSSPSRPPSARTTWSPPPRPRSPSSTTRSSRWSSTSTRPTRSPRSRIGSASSTRPRRRPPRSASCSTTGTCSTTCSRPTTSCAGRAST